MKQGIILVFVSSLLLFSCTETSTTVVVKNSLAVERSNETVELSMQQLGIESVEVFNTLGVIDAETKEVLLSQKIDTDADGVVDALIFQPQVNANSEKMYTLSVVEAEEPAESKVFSRFVPERTDDYAWENDKVAFRTFGPTAQKMYEDGDRLGTLSSGIDCWLKKVDYPVINIRYKGFLTDPQYYHNDHGNGYDPYHVGKSRGCGGIGVYIDDELFVSKNYTNYKTLGKGPVRTSFTLDYADWKAGNNLVKEKKYVSLDVGSNLAYFEEAIEGVDEITVGITLHEKEGETFVDSVNCFFGYWEPMRDSELGTAILVNPKYYAGYTKVVSDEPDKSQLLVHLKVIEGKVAYKAGFCWKESGQYPTQALWKKYLSKEAQKVQAPLQIEIR